MNVEIIKKYVCRNDTTRNWFDNSSTAVQKVLIKYSCFEVKFKLILLV